MCGAHFRHGYGRMIDAELGPASASEERPLSITFAVGGEPGPPSWPGTFCRASPPRCARGACGSTWLPGFVPRWRQYFRQIIGEFGIETELGRSIHLLWQPTKDEYFALFNQFLRGVTDVLWTKPSELCFYAALGIPLIMSAPLGAHEDRNLETVLRVGAGQRQEDPRPPPSGSPTGRTTACWRSTPSRAISTCRAWARRTSNACCSPRTAPRSPWTSGPFCPSGHSVSR